jgi:cardiolipin synthase A/B
LPAGSSSGPDEDISIVEMIMIGAINAPRTRVRLVTPYFRPDGTLHAALGVAARRGVAVDIVIPHGPNHPVVDWATQAQIGSLLDTGCHHHLSSGHLGHSKVTTGNEALSDLSH